MPNLVYYKDSSGVVSGPLKEEEATALLNANFFRPDHVFRSVDPQEAENFMSIDDLRSLNGAETPFGRKEEEKEEKELVRVYKELSIVLQESNALKVKADKYDGARKLLIEQFEGTIKTSNCFSVERFFGPSDLFKNNSSTHVRCLIDDSWNPNATQIVRANGSGYFPIEKSYIYIAPYLSDDPLDGSELVVTFRNTLITNPIQFK